MDPSARSATYRSGDFELDLAAYALRRQGRPVKIGRQPMDLLILLVERRRQLVSRTEIVDRLWGKDVFVDVETGVNTAISKVRQALRDPADAPLFVETVAGKGYRFIASVETATDPPAPGLDAQELVAPGVDAPEAVSPEPSSPHRDIPGPALRTRATSRPFVMGLVALAVVAAGAFAALTWRNGTNSATRVSLAVLPFEDLGRDPDRAYLAAGLTEETSALLGQIDPDRLSVKGRTLRYKGTTKTAAEIGRELSVDYLLESTVRAEGDHLRVTATLIRVPDQEHVWSRSYDREVRNLLVLQQDLSAAIAEQVRLKLAPDRVSGLARRQTENADAYDAYLKARYLEGRRTAATNAQAVQEYQRAIALDPNYALAWAGLSVIETANTISGDAPPSHAGPRAREAATNALRANPDLAEAQMAAGYANFWLDWDLTAAETALRRAIRLDPSNAMAHMFLGHLLSQAGRQSDAELAMRRARELEPLSPLNVALSSQVAFQGRDYRTAAEHARRAIVLDSTFWIGSMQLAQAYEQLGETELALAALADAARFSGGNSKTLSLRGYVLAKAGRTAEARTILAELEADATRRYVPPFAMALIEAGLDDRDAMFAWLDKAYAAHDVHLMYLPVDVKWDPYRGDPRFVALLAQCGFIKR